MKDVYKMTVRFDLNDARERNLAEFMQTLDTASELIPFFFIIPLIIFAPTPPIFIRDSPNFTEPRGIKNPNIFSIKLFFNFTLLERRRIFSPQKVKNIVTFLPIAAAPFAIMNAAIVLSRSPENTTNVLSLRSDVPEVCFLGIAFVIFALA